MGPRNVFSEISWKFLIPEWTCGSAVISRHKHHLALISNLNETMDNETHHIFGINSQAQIPTVSRSERRERRAAEPVWSEIMARGLKWQSRRLKSDKKRKTWTKRRNSFLDVCGCGSNLEIANLKVRADWSGLWLAGWGGERKGKRGRLWFRAY